MVNTEDTDCELDAEIEPGQLWTSDTDDGWGTVMTLDPVGDQSNALRHSGVECAWRVLNNNGMKGFIWASTLRRHYTLIPAVDEVDSEAEAEGSNRD
jgi:hypothetical protein